MAADLSYVIIVQCHTLLFNRSTIVTYRYSRIADIQFQYDLESFIAITQLGMGSETILHLVCIVNIE